MKCAAVFIIATMAGLFAAENATASVDAGAALRSLDAAAATQPTRPWLDSPADFARDHPGRWIVGRCHAPYLSEDQALQGARADAADAIAAINSDTQRFRGRLSEDIAAGQLQVDCFVERFDRPYGAVWAASVLLDASPRRLDELVGRYQSAWRAEQIRVAIFRGAVAAVIAVTWLMYAVLNTATRGYFTARLRLIAVMVCALALIFAF